MLLKLGLEFTELSSTSDESDSSSESSHDNPTSSSDANGDADKNEEDAEEKEHNYIDDRKYYETLRVPQEELLGNSGNVTDKEDSLPPVPMHQKNQWKNSSGQKQGQELETLSKIPEKKSKKHEHKKDKKKK